MKRPRSITLRLTLYFSIASTAVLLVGGFVIGRLVEAHLAEQDWRTLQGKLELVRATLADTRTQRGIVPLSAALDSALIGHHDLFVQVIGPDGRILYASSDLRFPEVLRSSTGPGAAANEIRSITWESDGGQYRAIAGSAATGIAGEAPAIAEVALNIDFHRSFMAEFRNSLWLAIAAGIVISALLGWVSARRGLAPARRMLKLTQRISANRLGERLPPESVPSELADLAVAFNDMLARLEDSFRRLSHFSSDLAHELRTPVGNLLMQTQVALSKARTADEYREVLYSNLEEYERLAHMTSDMLFLAKADNGLIENANETVSLDEEIRQLFAFYDALSEECGVDLVLIGEGSVRGDRAMLRRALGNLLANAIRHTAHGKAITVRIGRNGNRTELRVENPGEPIADEHLPRLFDRFYRVDPSRCSKGEGAGLGLAITKSIVEAHGGEIEASCAEGSIRFDIALPAD